VILIKNIYTLWGRKRFLLSVTYFPMNLVYPFTLQVTGIKMSVGSPKPVGVMASVPNPNLISSIFTRSETEAMSHLSARGSLKLRCRQYTQVPKGLEESLVSLNSLRCQTLRRFQCLPEKKAL